MKRIEKFNTNIVRPIVAFMTTKIIIRTHEKPVIVRIRRVIFRSFGIQYIYSIFFFYNRLQLFRLLACEH